MKTTKGGIDLAKNVIQVHNVDDGGRTVLKKPLKRDQVAPSFANLPPCLLGMEACGSADLWARKLEAYGHMVLPHCGIMIFIILAERQGTVGERIFTRASGCSNRDE